MEPLKMRFIRQKCFTETYSQESVVTFCAFPWNFSSSFIKCSSESRVFCHIVSFCHLLPFNVILILVWRVILGIHDCFFFFFFWLTNFCSQCSDQWFIRTPWTQDVNWTYIRRPGGLRNVLYKFNLRPILRRKPNGQMHIEVKKPKETN